MTLQLFSYQVEGVEFMARDERALILADTMGLGKTAQALRTLGDRGLVVCPPSLKYNWLDECRKWRPDLKPIVMMGVGLGSFKWPSTGELVIVGYNQIPEWMAMPGNVKSSKYAANDKSPEARADRARIKKLRTQNSKLRKDIKKRYESTVKSGVVDGLMLIADECQQVKNPDAQRSRRFRTLSGLCSYTRMLTGTPMPRGSVYDLLGILRACHLDQEIFPNYPRFQAISGALDGGPPTPAFHAALQPYMLRRRKEEVAPQLPPKMHQTHTIELDAKTSAKLEALDPEIVDAIRKATTPAQLSKIRAMPGFAEFSRTRMQIARARIPALIEYVENAEENDEPLLVFSAHREPVLALKGREGWAVITGDTPLRERQQIVRDQEKYKGIAVTIKAGGTGLTLTHFAHAVFLDLDWDITQNQQAEDRIHRHGQKAATVMYTIFTSTTAIDRLVTSKLARASLNIDIAIEGL